MIKWSKRGRIFEARGQFSWMSHHAAVPVPVFVADDRLRIYFSARDDEGRSRPGFIDVDPSDPAKLLYLHDQPVLELGKLGTFDEDGVMPCCVFDVGQERYMCYTGWNRGVRVPYRNAIGLAVSTDRGLTFNRVYDGPVVDRNAAEPYFTGVCHVLLENGVWRMWYLSTTSWIVIDGKPEPLYVIKYAESPDGVEWKRDNVTCIPAESPTEAIARPWVIRDGDTYRMWYSHRESVAFRTDRENSYRIGYAESNDGLSWERRDEDVEIDVSTDGWDSLMIEYPAVYSYNSTLQMLYNGNGFGETGFGYAVADGG